MGSIWDGGAELPAFPPLDKNLNVDVLIIGGGLAGLLCAYLLDREGASYALVESRRLLSGVTGRTTAKITSQHGLIYDKLSREFGLEAAGLYLRANEEALDKYRELCADIDCDFQVEDNYVYTLSSPEKLCREYDALKALGYPAKLVKRLPLPLPALGAVCFPCQARFDPLKFAVGIARGLNIYENTPVRELRGTTAVTDSHEIHAKKLIIATHFPMNNKHGLYFLKLYQQRSYVLALKNAEQYEGMYVDESGKGLSFRNQGELLLLGGGGHRTGKRGGGFRELEDFKALHYPGAEEVCRWATQDCMTLDGAPYIGRYSRDSEGLYVATGFNKWGMSTAMAAALLLRDLTGGKTSPYEAVFDPSRTLLRPQLAVNAFEAAVSLVTPTRPRCPHLGCALKWNEAEKSWDCPCHGSRFAEDGSLLDNPATGDLKL